MNKISVVQLSEFSKNCQFQFLKYFRINPFKEQRIKKLWILVISKTLKEEPVGFMKELAAGQLFDFFNSFESYDYMAELGCFIFENHGYVS
jgi:hypothetical protein